MWGSKQPGFEGWPCITPSLASTSLEEQTEWEWLHVSLEIRGKPRWSPGPGLFSMILVGSTTCCPKAQWDTIPTSVPLWFSEFQSLLPAAVEEQLVPAKLVLG